MSIVLPIVSYHLAIIPVSLPRGVICVVGVVLAFVYLRHRPWLMGLVAATYGALVVVPFFRALQRWEFYVAAMLSLGLAAFLGRDPAEK